MHVNEAVPALQREAAHTDCQRAYASTYLVHLHQSDGLLAVIGAMLDFHEHASSMRPSDLSDFSALLLKLYRLAHEAPIDGFQDAALDLIKPVLPFDSSLWGTATMTAAGVDIHTSHLHQSSPEMLLDYEQHKAHDTAAQAVLARSQATGTFHTASTVQDAGLRDFLSRYGHENIFITASTDPSTRFVHAISLFRADRDALGREAECQWLECLRPHLMQALALNRATHLQLWAPAASGLPRGLAIADVRGVVYHADPQFDVLLRAEWAGWHGGALPPALLTPMLAGAGAFTGATLVVRGKAQHGLLFLRARPRCTADALSTREWAVATLMAQGCTHKQVAQRLNRAPATVRNHLQSIYGKLAVTNIAGLIEALRLAA